MTRPASPHAELLRVAETLALAAFDDVARQDGDAPAPAGFEAFGSWLARLPPDAPLRRIADGFVLDAAETALLVLLFAAALSEPVARRVASASAEADGRGVPVWLAQRLVPGLGAEMLAASGTLRRFGFVHVEERVLRIEARLALTEAVLDRLCGVEAREPEVAARIAPFAPPIVEADPNLARRLKTALASRGADGLSPVVLAGPTEAAEIAAALAAVGLTTRRMPAAEIPEDPVARDRLARLWSREAAIDGSALVVVVDQRPAPGLAAFCDRVFGHVVVIGPASGAGFVRGVRLLGQADAVVADPALRWRTALGPARVARLGAGLNRVAAHFRLDPPEIEVVCARVADAIDLAPDRAAADRLLWRAAGRTSLGPPVAGVTIVEPVSGWSDIVLAPHIETTLRRVETHVRQATTVMDDWGFAERMGGRGRGVAALFAGPSGTGKTMAAEVLASSLDLRMMLIDLSQIISKYVGETSKNIAAAFDQAERCGAVMVWNEGDAIWGARGAVGNATDRHVNAEVGDLLQRIEAFRGFTVVTTNLRHAIDPAFLRRFRFIVDFPMPSEPERLRLWRQAFPTGAPVEAIDWGPLAALPLSGGSIRNVALGSAFLAAEDGVAIDRGRISAEVAEELRKHNQPTPTIDWGTRQ